jgi:hypothetical protein
MLNLGQLAIQIRTDWSELGHYRLAAMARKDSHPPAALLDNGTILRLPPPEAERMQAFLQPGQQVAVRCTNLVTPLGTVIGVTALGNSPGQLTEFAVLPPRGPKGGPKGTEGRPRRAGPDAPVEFGAPPPPPRRG